MTQDDRPAFIWWVRVRRVENVDVPSFWRLHSNGQLWGYWAQGARLPDFGPYWAVHDDRAYCRRLRNEEMRALGYEMCLCMPISSVSEMGCPACWLCRHCGDHTDSDDPAPDLCVMCERAGRTNLATQRESAENNTA